MKNLFCRLFFVLLGSLGAFASLAGELLFFDDFEGYADTAALEKNYLITRVGVEMPKLSYGIANGGAKSLALFCNGRAGKIRMPRIIRPDEGFDLEFDLMFTPKYSEGISVLGGNENLNWNSKAFGIPNLDAKFATEKWTHIRISFAPGAHGKRNVRLFVDRKLETESLMEAATENRDIEYFRFGVNGNGNWIYIDNIAVRVGDVEDEAKTEKNVRQGLEKLPEILKKRANEAIDQAQVWNIDVDGDGQKEPVLLNGNVVLAFQPGKGGRGVFLAFRKELKNLSGADGVMRDLFWKEAYVNQPLCELPYQWEAGADESGAFVKMKVKGRTGFYKYLTIERTVRLAHNDATFYVGTTYHNDPNSVGTLTITPWFHNEIGFAPETNVFHYFSPYGRRDIPQQSIASEFFWKDPMKNFYAISSPEGTVVCSMDYPYLQSLYTWSGSYVVPTFEWRLFPVSIPQDERFSFSYELTLLPGKVVPDGVGRHGEIVSLYGDSDSENIKLHCVLSGNNQKARIRVTGRALLPVSSDKAAEIFSGDAKSAQNITIPWAGKTAQIITAEYTGTDGKLIASAERIFTMPGVVVDYEYPPRESRMMAEEKQSSRIMDDAYMIKLDLSQVTPHFPWAKPIAGKNIKALVLTPAMGMREIVELAQRFPLDVETVYINQGPAFINGDFFGVDMDQKSIQVLRKKLADNYDVIILGGIDVDTYFPGEMSRMLLDKVRGGTGLVCISGANFPAVWQEAFPGRIAGRSTPAIPEITELGKQHFLTQGFSAELLGRISTIANHTAGALMKADTNHCASAVELGKGRVFFIEYHNDTTYYGRTGGGLTQFTPDIFSRGNRWDFDYHEYSLMLAGRAAIWAAGRDGEFHSFSRIQAMAPKTVELVWDNTPQAGKAAKVTGEISDQYGRVVSTFAQDVTGVNQVGIQLARPLVSGINRLKCQLWNEDGQVVGFGAAQFQIDGLPVITQATCEELESGVLQCDFSVSGTLDAPFIRLVLKDGYGRICADETVPFQPRVTLPLARMASHFGSLDIALLKKDGNLVAVSRIPVARMDSAAYRQWDNFRLMICGLLRVFAARDYLLPYYYERFHEMGCKYLIDDVPNISGRFFGFDMYMHALGGMAEKWGDMTYWKENFEKTGDKKYLMRKRDFDNHDFLDASVKQMTWELDRNQAAQAHWVMVDEDEYSMPGLDFDFSPTSLAEFRRYLHAEYGSLDALNQEWGSSFVNWDAVEPSTYKEILQRTDGNYSSWADHRTFNNVTVNKAWTFYREMLKRHAPGTLMAQSGTRPTLAYGGNDWYLLMNTFSYMLPYSLYKQQYAYQTGFSKIPLAPWLGGYAKNDVDEMYFDTMRCGRLGLSVYAGVSMLACDFSRLSDTAETVRQAMYYPLRGRGELVHKAQREEEVAIYFSVPSYQAAWITGNEQLHDVNWKGYVQLFEDMNIGYTFLASQQVRDGELIRRMPKLLVLPLVYALSAAEVKEIQGYVEAGGHLLMDASAGIMDAHCRLLKQSLLGEKMSRISWGNTPVSEKKRTLQFDGKTLKLSQTTEDNSILFKAYGKGSVTLLHGLFAGDYAFFSQNRLQADMRKQQWEILDFFSNFFDRCNVKRILRTSTDKQVLPLAAVGWFENQSRYLVVKPLQGAKSYEFDTGDNKVWFNTHTGECLGTGPRITAALKGTTILAGLPLDCGMPEMTLSATELQPGDPLEIRVRSTSAVNTRQVWSLEVFDPSGKSVPAYLNCFGTPDGGLAVYTLHTALNDVCGEWTITVTDAATGRQASGKVILRKE